MMTHNEGGAVQVKVGQVWADNDPRTSGNRMLRVDAIEARLPVGRRRSVGKGDALPDHPTHAVCMLGFLRGDRFMPHLTGRQTIVRLDRFRPTSTGYRLVSDVPEPQPSV